MGEIGSDLNFVLGQAPKEPTQAMPGLQEAQVLTADANGLFVTIPTFHPDWSFGPCRYSWPIQGFPPPDSTCLVAFTGDDLTRPWVVSWGAAPRTPLALPGADAALTRYVGGTSLGPPATGTFARGDFAIAQDGTSWVCITGGSPGTWKPNYAGAQLPGAVAASRYAGATTSGAPTTGTYAVGDFVVDQTGLLWICRTAGTPGGWRSSQDKPVGDVELSLALKPNQLALVGQTVLRSAYPALWAWAQAKSLVVAGLFGAGDGSTTFVLPNMSGRVPVGVGTLGADTYALGGVGGSTLKTLVTANLPEHDHQITVDTHGNHHHDLTGGTVPGGGNHGGHFPGDQVIAARGPDYGVSPWNSGGVGSGDHGHGAVAVFAIDNSAGAHTVRRTALPAATAFDARPAYAPLMYAIWY